MAKDCYGDSFEIILTQQCFNSTCEKRVKTTIGDTSVEFVQDNRLLYIDGLQYEMRSISALNEVLFKKSGLQIINYGNEIAIVSEHLQVIYYISGDLKIHIDETFYGKTCGLCGNADCISENDQIDSEKYELFALNDYQCQPENITCDKEMIPHIDAICETINDEIFSICHQNADNYMDLCRSETCECLKSGKPESECKCSAISHFVESCQRSQNTCVAENWRGKLNCSVPLCPADKIWRECGEPCPKSCKDVLSDEVDCPVSYSQPGCFCPPGFYINDFQ